MRRSNTKEKILRSSILLFSEFGYDAVSIRQIAAHVGIQSGSLYNHFKSKQDIMDQIFLYIDEFLSHYSLTREETLELLKTTSPRQILNRFITYYKQEDNELALAIYRLVFSEVYHSEALRGRVYNYFIHQPAANIQRVLDIMVETGHIPPCDTDLIAEGWSRVYLVYGLLASHELDNVDYHEYWMAGDFFIQMALNGVRQIPLEHIELHWNSLPFFPDDSLREESGTKESILMRSVDLFSENGYNSVSIRQIANECGIQGASIYNHFSSKGDILKTIVDRILNDYKKYSYSNPAFRAVLQEGNPLRVILSLSTAYLPAKQELVRKVYRILFQEQYQNEDLKDLFISSILRDCHTIEETLLQLGGQESIYPGCNSRLAAVAYVHTMCSITWEITIFPEREQQLENLRLRMVGFLVSYVINGFQKEPPSEEQ